MKKINDILNHILRIENGFKHINDGATEIMKMYPPKQCFELALDLFKHEAYQARMLATTLFGLLAVENDNALRFLKEQVSTDENWRVQEMLAKAFDEVCKHRRYEASLPLIEEWINDNNQSTMNKSAIVRMDSELRTFWNRAFCFNWKFGLFLVIAVCIPRFMLVLHANASESYGTIGLIMTLSAIVPFLFLNKHGRQEIGITKPQKYNWLLIAF